MISFPGYKDITQIYQSNNSTIFKGVQEADSKPIIIKLLNKEYPSREEILHFRREYEITANLTGNHVINAYGLQNLHNNLAIILEDFGGRAVAEFLNEKRIDLTGKIRLAIKMTEALAQIHSQHIIHKDVNPSNFVWNPETEYLKIIDFGIATELSRENTGFINLKFLEGTLPYISPEQTGRMNRSIDYRTDFYSLGATFYHIFTEQLPFKGQDDIGLVHAHIARTAVSPDMISSEIPPAIANIIMKLLAKNAEERYQSAVGLKKDLEYCLEEWVNKGTIEVFSTDNKDIPAHFNIPQRFYGREKESVVLFESFKAVINGNMRLLLVAGYSGVGKSSLIYEMHRSIISRNGYFISGKFDEFERNTPYHGLILALDDLVRQLLYTSEDQLEDWKKRLLTALGPNGHVMTDLIPDLAKIIGPQPLVAELKPREAHNRFNLAVRAFLGVFAQNEHPLVIFLDDLQWSDFSTLEILKYLLLSTGMKNLLVIGAYRDNEVKSGHPLTVLLEDVKQQFHGQDVPFRTLLIKPLPSSSVSQLLTDAFHCDPDAISELHDLVLRKTAGNPFYIKQFLIALNTQGAFKINPQAGCWEWDLSVCNEASISENVVDFLIQRFKQLSPGVREVISCASVIGNVFPLQLLFQASDRSSDAIADKVWEAIKNEIIIALDENYQLLRPQKDARVSRDISMNFKFKHDRIQQAAYGLIPEKERPSVHLKIGRLLEKQFSETESSAYIFDIVNHLNIGRELITVPEERAELVRLNNQAGKQAQKSAAFAIAAEYFKTARSLLSPEQWRENPAQLFRLVLAEAESTFFAGKAEEAKRLCTHLFELATDKLDLGAAYVLESKVLDFLGVSRETLLSNIRKALKLFDFELPEDPKEIEKQVSAGITTMMAHLEKNPFNRLHLLPQNEDENRIMMMNLLFEAISPAIMTNFPLFMLIELTLFDFAVRYGTTEVCCKVFIDCGIIMGPVLNNYDGAYKFSEAAFKLLKVKKADSQKSSVYFIFSTFISHWRVHYTEGLAYYDLARQTGLETGDIQFTCYAWAHKLFRYFFIGKNLQIFRVETGEAISFFTETNSVLSIFNAEIVLHFIDKFQADADREKTIEDAETKMLERIHVFNNLFFSYIFGQFNTIYNYLMGNWESADHWTNYTTDFIEAGAGHFYFVDYYLFQSLVLIKKWMHSSSEEQTKIMEKLIENKNKLQFWSDNSPENFSHKYYLLSAEIARIGEEPVDSILNLYKKANDAIGKDDFTQMRALIYELQGEFWLTRGHETIGKTFIQEAYFIYEKWGAIAKLRQMGKEYPQWLISYTSSEKDEPITSPHGSHHSKEVQTLDIASITKSTQAISGEVKIDKLLNTLMLTIMENAGAQHGCLLLKHKKDNRLYIEAYKNTITDTIEVLQSLPLDSSRMVCPEIVQYVDRTQKSIVLDNASSSNEFCTNPYITENSVKSVLCTPINYQKKFKGIIYLENNLAVDTFNQDRLKVVNILSSQAAIALENAQLYESLEEKVNARTEQLNVANKKLKKLSNQDPLTQLYNRRYMYEFFTNLKNDFLKDSVEIPYDADEKMDISDKMKIMGIYMVDIDFFKEVNDMYGHKTGDDVLTTISGVLKKMIRSDDLIVRWGGEEFLIILNNTEITHFRRLPEKILHAIRSTPIKVLNDKTIYKTCSIGFTQVHLGRNFPNLLTLEQTINLCDYALYMAKESGRNRAVHISLKKSPEKDQKMKEYLAMLSKESKIDSTYISLEYI